MEKTNISVNKMAPSGSNLQRLIEESRGAAKDSVKRTARVSILLDDVIDWIKRKYDDVYIVNELIKVASGCPQGSLNRFVSSVDIHLRRIQKQRGDRVKKKEVNIEAIKEKREKEIIRQRILRNQQEREISKELNEIMSFEEEIPQMPQVEEIKSQPQPQRTQPQPQSQPISKEQLEMRRLFAQRLSEASQDDEIDGEWMR